MKATIAATALFFITALVFHPALHAQQATGKYEFNAGGGIFIYQGDLAPSFLGGVKNPRPGLQLGVTRFVSNRLGISLRFHAASLKTDESLYKYPEWRQQRNLNFKTGVKELSVLAVYNLRGNNFAADDYRRLTPYVFAGAGLAFTKVTRNAGAFNAAYFGNESWVNAGLQEDLARSTPKLVPVIPLGAGVKYRLTEKWSLFSELNYRRTFTDYLDGFSKAGNPGRKDHYYGITMGAVFRPFGNNSIKCPAVRF